jgi:AmmeMemoRadiSam system protein A
MPAFGFTADERQQFLALARQSILAHLTHGPRPRLDIPAADQRHGAFVSLHVHGELRGCIGYPAADEPLNEVIARCAVSAASSDPRFPPLTLAELSVARIEISVLGPIEPVTNVDEIVVGRHGLIIGRGFSRGLLLPQVATEQRWDRDTFLTYTCLKAGLPRDAWRKGANIEKFEAEVFGEPAPTS